MAAYRIGTEIYVRPTNGDDANDGLSHVNAVETIAEALAISTYSESGDGTRINLCDEADHVLTAEIDLTEYFGGDATNSQRYGLTFQGYTSVADDGGVGVIDCDSNRLAYSTNIDAVMWKHLTVKDAGGTYVARGGNYWRFDRVTFENCAPTTGFLYLSSSLVVNCTFDTIAESIRGASLIGCKLAISSPATNLFVSCPLVFGNLMTVTGMSGYLWAGNNESNQFVHNTLIGLGSNTNAEIIRTANTNTFNSGGLVAHNVFYGFNSSGLKVFDFNSFEGTMKVLGNLIYNCTSVGSPGSDNGWHWAEAEAYQIASVDPFVDYASDDFRLTQAAVEETSAESGWADLNLVGDIVPGAFGFLPTTSSGGGGRRPQLRLM